MLIYRRTINVNSTEPNQRIIFRLGVDESVMGLPRLLFVLTIGCLCVLIIGCIAMLITCYQQRKKNRSHYSFSLLSQKPDRRKLFEDDDEVDETELFRTPIKSKCKFNELRILLIDIFAVFISRIGTVLR